MKKRYRSVLGFASMIAGLLLLISAAFLSGESHLSSTTRGVAVTASAIGGGFLTFVVSRRLLTAPDE